MAKEAIQLHIDAMLDDGEEIPTPTTEVDKLRSDPIFADAIWALVPCRDRLGQAPIVA